MFLPLKELSLDLWDGVLFRKFLADGLPFSFFWFVKIKSAPVSGL